MERRFGDTAGPCILSLPDEPWIERLRFGELVNLGTRPTPGASNDMLALNRGTIEEAAMRLEVAHLRAVVL